MHWMEQLTALGGVASRRQLLAAGATSDALTEAVRAGLLFRPRRGSYASLAASDAALEAARSGGRLCCVSAARSYGLWAGTDQRTHIRVARHATRLPYTLAVRHWMPAERPGREIWRDSIDDCLVSVVHCADEETAVAVLDTAISAGLTSLRVIGELFAGESVRARAVSAKARPGSDSGVESIVRQRLTKAGHLVEQQIGVAGVGRVDLRVDGRLYIEIDGYAWHSDRGAFERDRARDTGLAMYGFLQLRFPARDVLEHWPDVARIIETVLAAPDVTGPRAGQSFVQPDLADPPQKECARLRSPTRSSLATPRFRASGDQTMLSSR